MKIFIDESGLFIPSSKKPEAFSLIGSFIIPDKTERAIEKDFLNFCRKHSLDPNIKGNKIISSQLLDLFERLSSYDALFVACVIDLNKESQDEIIIHQKQQSDNFLHYVTEEHSNELISELKNLQKQLLGLSPQLYVQSVLQTQNIYDVIQTTLLYYSQIRPLELKKYRWIIDRKSPHGLTSYEKYWDEIVAALLQWKSYLTPFKILDGGNYFYLNKSCPPIEPSAYMKKLFPSEKQTFDLTNLITNREFCDDTNMIGLRISDIFSNTLRRVLYGEIEFKTIEKIGLFIPKNYQISPRFVSLTNNTSYGSIINRESLEILHRSSKPIL